MKHLLCVLLLLTAGEAATRAAITVNVPTAESEYASVGIFTTNNVLLRVLEDRGFHPNPGTYSNCDSAGNFVITNASVTGQEEWPVAPGAGVQSVTSGISTSKIIFQ